MKLYGEIPSLPNDRTMMMITGTSVLTQNPNHGGGLIIWTLKVLKLNIPQFTKAKFMDFVTEKITNLKCTSNA